jgi:hypothetical protein
VIAENASERRTGMGKLVVSENVTLDGVVQDPAGDEGFRLGGWVGLIKDDRRHLIRHYELPSAGHAAGKSGPPSYTLSRTVPTWSMSCG